MGVTCTCDKVRVRVRDSPKPNFFCGRGPPHLEHCLARRLDRKPGSNKRVPIGYTTARAPKLAGSLVFFFFLGCPIRPSSAFGLFPKASYHKSDTTPSGSVAKLALRCPGLNDLPTRSTTCVCPKPQGLGFDIDMFQYRRVSLWLPFKPIPQYGTPKKSRPRRLRISTGLRLILLHHHQALRVHPDDVQLQYSVCCEWFDQSNPAQATHHASDQTW